MGVEDYKILNVALKESFRITGLCRIFIRSDTLLPFSRSSSQTNKVESNILIIEMVAIYLLNIGLYCRRKKSRK